MGLAKLGHIRESTSEGLTDALLGDVLPARRRPEIRRPLPSSDLEQPMAYRDVETRKLRDRERFRKRTAERRAAGLCPRCGDRAPASGRSLCEPCAERRNRASQIRDARLRAAGKPRRDPERAKQYEHERSRRRTAERLAAGLCTKCGVNSPEPEQARHELVIGRSAGSTAARLLPGESADGPETFC